MLQLFSYYRSSAAYRVRIALALKGLDVSQIPVNLLKNEQRGESYLAVNPQGLVPALVTEEGELLTQSLAIIEYLEEAYPTTPALLPADPLDRARVRSLAQILAADTAPLNNLRVQKYLSEELEIKDKAKSDWIKHWIATGLGAFEAMLQDGKTGKFCHGDKPGLAECVLLPQVYSARRFDCDLSAYPTIGKIVKACELLAAFKEAHPDAQADRPAA